jgi:hypothetical protein
MGFPHQDGSLLRIQTKLTLGMMTYSQAKFILRECARCLQPNGTLTVIDRDVGLLGKRQADLDPKMFIRYVYGSGLYYGSRRRSFWTPSWVQELASIYNLHIDSIGDRGMNFTMQFTRGEGSLRAYAPEPKLIRNEDGSIRNEGDDFHQLSTTYQED